MSNKKDVSAGVLNKLTIKSVFGTENPEKNTGNTQIKIEGINIPQRESYGKTHPTLSEVKAFFLPTAYNQIPIYFLIVMRLWAGKMYTIGKPKQRSGV